MRYIKALFGVALMVVALAALTSSSASAATCKHGESEAEHKVLCIEGKQVGSSKEAVTTAAALTLKTGTSVVINVATQEWSVSCARLETYGSPRIKSGSSGSVQLEETGFRFNECKVLLGAKEEPKCSVEAASTNPLGGSLASPESIVLAGSTSFGELDISGCILSGDIPIKGSQGCGLKQPEVEAVAKELVCEPKNSKLTFGGGFGGPPTLKLEGNLELAGASKGKKFSITK